MKPADLRRAVNNTPFRTFRLWLARSDWPILCCYADDWTVSPSGKFFVYAARGQSLTIRAEQIARVEYVDEVGEDV
ncbi:MAG: hypothetical protein ACXVB5_14535 [Isosphaeraceae bacterium]